MLAADSTSIPAYSDAPAKQGNTWHNFWNICLVLLLLKEFKISFKFYNKLSNMIPNVSKLNYAFSTISSWFDSYAIYFTILVSI